MSVLLAALPVIGDLISKYLPDPQAKAAMQLDLLKLQQEGAFREMEADTRISLAQAEINKVEAASQNGFQAGWRPLAGYVCVVGMAYEFLLRPLLPWCLIVAGVPDVPPLPSLESVLWELTFGMLGLGTLRSGDRWIRNTTIRDMHKS